MDQLWKIRYPFNGDYHITFPFGATSTNEHINHKLSQLRLKGHSGLDFGLPVNTPVTAVYDGTVILAGDKDSYGRTIIIKHSWGESLYAHLADIKVAVGQMVKESDLIGTSGDTGYTFGPHLHFAIKPSQPDIDNGYHGFIDPQPYFSQAIKTNDPLSSSNARNIAVTFECFIRKDDKYLMLKRSDTKKIMPGILMAPGGKREFNEGLFAATYREVKEETGLSITNLQIRATGNAYIKNIKQEFFFHFVFADWKSGDYYPHTNDGDFIWMSASEILENPDTLAEIKHIGPALFELKDAPISFVALYESGNNLTSFILESPSQD